MRRRLAFVLAAALLASSAGPDVRGGEITVGTVREAQNREGVQLREQPIPLGRRLARVPYGTKLKVLEVRDLWVRVTTLDTPASAGWARGNELVAPGVLAGGAAAAPSLSSSDVSAASRQFNDPTAGKQFDRKTEFTFRTMDARLNDAYAAVDRIEREKPSDEEVEAFVREGRLGGTGDAATPNGAGSYAKLKVLGATGQTDGVIVFEDEFTPLPPAVEDGDFVRRLGVGFSLEQEYWVGRAVAAAAIAEHGLDTDAQRQAMVKRIGAAIVTLSDRLRQTHGGWHFAVLNSDVPNGISGPGGFVLVTKGALALARNEDEVAGILAHEMAHVAYKHGEQMIRKSREFQEQLRRLEERIVRGPQRGEDCNICGEVARTLGESAKALVKNLDGEGYARELELAADWAGSLFLCEVGYRASAIAEYLEMLPSREGARWTTHPSSEDRIEALRPLVFKHGCPFESDEGAQARLPRFRAIALR